MIELRNVSFQYGEEDSAENRGALCNISLTIPRGQTVLLCGESGCGKTTITRLINGLVPHFYDGKLTGEVRINGQEIKDQPLYDTAENVGTVFQNPRSQFFNVDTRSELAFSLENRGMKAADIIERVHDTVEEYQMEYLMDRSIFELSGGEKQKIACGCVSAGSPDIFVLDEPSANLDMKSIAQLRTMIEKWKRQGKTIVIAEHRLFYIWELIDRAVYLKNGKIEKDMKPDVFRRLTENQLHDMGLRASTETKHNINHAAFLKSGEPLVFKEFVYGYQKKENVLDIREMLVPEKEITALTGNNGIGKTTFLRCVCGLEKKCKGTMEYEGKVYKRKKRLEEMFLVMQDVNHQLFTESVLEEVLISMKTEDQEKAEKILYDLDLLEYKDRHPISLSGGQKQRVAVATAIASERKILLFDEPTSGLDYHHMLQVAGVLKRLKNMGKTILVVTHDWEFIQAIDAHIMKLDEQTAERRVEINESEKFHTAIV